MYRNIGLAGLIGAVCLTANAAVVVNLDGMAVNEVQAIHYHAGGGLFELVLADNLACQGITSIGPLAGLGLGVGDQIFELAGPITMNFSTGPTIIEINSDSGNLNCNSDRIFSDRLAKK